METKALIAALFIFCFQISFAQHKVYSNLKIEMEEVYLPKYTITEPKLSTLKTAVIYNGFGEFTITNEEDLLPLRNSSVLNVDLVYTQYPEDKDFDLLNKQRLQYLQLLSPEVFANPGTTWKLIAQTGGTRSTAPGMFHGFVITYREAAAMESEVVVGDYISSIISGKTAPADSTVLKVFQRNEFNEGAVVADFTGSMSPYIAQVMLWYELTFHTSKFGAFTFFNDGDMKPDRMKKAGETGGVYISRTTDKDTVMATAMTCITNGCGGDGQENDVEAILATIKKYPKLKEVILIADNMAPMRDYFLGDQIKIPVRVVLCGTAYGINPQYLNLAYQTKGSIHTMEEDLTNLMEVNDGKDITINGQKFRLKDKKFTLITES